MEVGPLVDLYYSLMHVHMYNYHYICIISLGAERMSNYQGNFVSIMYRYLKPSVSLLITTIKCVSIQSEVHCERI